MIARLRSAGYASRGRGWVGCSAFAAVRDERNCMRQDFFARLVVGSFVFSVASLAGAAQDADPAVNSTTETAAVNLQPAAENAARDAAPRKLDAEVSLYGMHLFSADFENSSSDVSVTGGGAGIEFSIPVAERGSLTISAGAEYWNYDFSDGNAFFPLADAIIDPVWEEIYVGTIGVSWRNQLNDNWGYTVGFELTSAGEPGADFSDTLTYGGFAGFSYAFSRDFVLGFGLGVQTQLEDDALVVPVPIIQWRINEQWSLTSKRVGNLGGVAINYAASDSITLSLLGGYERNDFRLDDDGPIPDGVGRHSGIPVVLNVAWQAAPQISLNAWGGYFFAQEYELIDSNEATVAEPDADSSALVGVGATFTF